MKSPPMKMEALKQEIQLYSLTTFPGTDPDKFIQKVKGKQS